METRATRYPIRRQGDDGGRSLLGTGRDLVMLPVRCTEERSESQQGMPAAEPSGFELFRRALVAREERAWEAIYACYGSLVRRWARRAGSDPDAVESVLAAAFERLWRAVDAAKFDRFPDLRSLLRYLKLCVQAAEIDRRRRAARQALEVALEAPDAREGIGSLAAADDTERQALETVSRQEFWEVIQRRCGGQQELLVIRLSFLEGLPPREICRRAPTQFPSVRDVYRAKRNVLDRLRHSAAVQEVAMT